jgi:aminoglycoside 3-N-acetyltransferase
MYYNYENIKDALEAVGVTKGRTVLVKTDLRFLGPFEKLDKESILMALYNALSELIDFSKGTLVVSTASHKIINTNTPFDLRKTPSERGIFTQYICNKKESIRSFHPFDSYTAIGKNAKYICCDVSRHSYGPETPKARMLDLDTLYISIGLHPRMTCTVVHHIEMIMGVPYRYVKEFVHPVVRNNVIKKEPFYLHVWYKQCQIEKNKNEKIFNHFYKSGYELKKHVLGCGNVYSYSMVDFFNSTVKLFKDDIYVFLNKVPERNPYRETM